MGALDLFLLRQHDRLSDGSEPSLAALAAGQTPPKAPDPDAFPGRAQRVAARMRMATVRRQVAAQELGELATGTSEPATPHAPREPQRRRADIAVDAKFVRAGQRAR